MKAQEPQQQRTRVNVKLAAGVPPEQAEQLLATTPGLLSTLQLFPDEPDEELQGLFMLEIEAPQLEDALQQLQHNSKLEYAHATAPRKLIR